MTTAQQHFSKTGLYLTFGFYFWLDSDLDVDALREERRRLLAICSCRFSLASCLQEQKCVGLLPLVHVSDIAQSHAPYAF